MEGDRQAAASPGRRGSRGCAGRRGWWRSKRAVSAAGIWPPKTAGSSDHGRLGLVLPVEAAICRQRSSSSTARARPARFRLLETSAVAAVWPRRRRLPLLPLSSTLRRTPRASSWSLTGQSPAALGSGSSANASTARSGSMWLSLRKAITLSIGLSFHDSYELVIRDELVVVAKSDDPGPRGRFDVRALDFVSVSASRMVNHVLGDCGLRLGLASTGIRVPETHGWRSSRQGLWLTGSSGPPRRQWCAFFRKLLGPSWRDGLICDRPVVQRAGLRMHT